MSKANIKIKAYTMALDSTIQGEANLSSQKWVDKKDNIKRHPNMPDDNDFVAITKNGVVVATVYHDRIVVGTNTHSI